MSMVKIDLNELMSNEEIKNTKLYGNSIRDLCKLDQRDLLKEQVFFKLNFGNGVSLQFLEGLFSKSILTLGLESFLDKYKFNIMSNDIVFAERLAKVAKDASGLKDSNISINKTTKKIHDHLITNRGVSDNMENIKITNSSFYGANCEQEFNSESFITFMTDVVAQLVGGDTEEFNALVSGFSKDATIRDAYEFVECINVNSILPREFHIKEGVNLQIHNIMESYLRNLPYKKVDEGTSKSLVHGDDNVDVIKGLKEIIKNYMSSMVKEASFRDSEEMLMKIMNKFHKFLDDYDKKIDSESISEIIRGLDAIRLDQAIRCNKMDYNLTEFYKLYNVIREVLNTYTVVRINSKDAMCMAYAINKRATYSSDINKEAYGIQF